MVAGCASDDGASEAERTEALVAQMLGVYDQAAMYRCECLVAADLLYDSVDACLMVLSPGDAWGECVQMAFADEGTAELVDALQCHTDHLQSVQACAESVGCEASVDGACDAMASESPCGNSTIDLLNFVFAHCPDIPMNTVTQ